MSTKRSDISQIKKYLKGELDARAMHQLERKAQDDPFLMDALDGYASNKDQQANLNELKRKLSNRIASQPKKRIILWPVISIAATVLGIITIGGWWLLVYQPSVKNLSLPRTENVTLVKPAPPAAKSSPAPVSADQEVLAPAIPKSKQQHLLADNSAKSAPANQVTQVEDALKKLPGVTVDPATGNVIAQGQEVAKTRINGKDYAGANVKAAARNLPPDVLKNVQIIDDYGDQAHLTGIKSTEPAKLLEITTNGAKADTAGKNTITPVTTTLQGRVSGVQVSPAKSSGGMLREISGLVRDQAGAGLASAIVRNIDKNQTAVTDATGRFKIEAAKEDELRFASIGYSSQQLKVGNRDSINVALEASGGSLNEVVVVGYGTQRKSAVTSTTDPKAHPVTGWDSFNNYIKNNAGSPDGKAGTVKVRFVVNPDNSLSDFNVVKSLSPATNAAAINLIKNGPKWVHNTNSRPETVTVKIRFKK